MNDFEKSFDNAQDKFYNIALRFLSYRPRSEKEMREHLRIKNQESRIKNLNSIIDRVVQKLKEYNFIDDVEFTKWWIESRMRFKPRSLRLIKIELKQKGVDTETIEGIVASRGSQVADDLENAKRLIERKMNRFQNLFGMTQKEIYQKLGRYLASKGFDWDTIKKSKSYLIKK